MNHPQVLVHEPLPRLAQLLRDAVAQRSLKWLVREPRTEDACFKYLRSAKPGVLVVQFGEDPTADLSLLEQAVWLFPEAAAVAVSDRDDPALAALAWDLGATHVLVPMLSRDLFVELVLGLMPND